MKIKIKNIKPIFLIIVIISIIIFNISDLKIRENFEWTNRSAEYFLRIQELNNPSKIFDVDLLQEKNNITQKQLNYFNKNKKWEWKPETKELYINAIKQNPYIRTSSKDSLNYAMTIYDDASIIELISKMSKEGDFLINGVLVPSSTTFPSGFGDFMYNSGLLDNNMKDVIKCNLDKGQLERTTYTKNYGKFGEQEKQTTDVNYENLEDIIGGFSFIDEPCNPCNNISNTDDKKCKFQLKTKKDEDVSDVWKYIWNSNN